MGIITVEGRTVKDVRRDDFPRIPSPCIVNNHLLFRGEE